MSNLDDFARQENVGLVVVDMQEGFVGKLPDWKSLVERQIGFLNAHSNHPVIGLELFPDSYGVTIPALKDVLALNGNGRILQKFTDDGFGSGPLKSTLYDMGLTRLVLLGCNTSWCVWETAKSAVDNGYEVGTSRRLISEPGYYPQWHGGRSEASLRWYRENCAVFDQS